MTTGDILARDSKSWLLNDPFAEKVWDLMHGESLFHKSPDHLSDLRMQMIREGLFLLFTYAVFRRCSPKRLGGRS
jgi:hypothetical protein